MLTGAGLQRDGGIADMLAEAASPEPRFAVVACEDIERSARDTFNALKIEKELARNGIILAATDEPPQIEGANATMILVRRVKQGVAEWYRAAAEGEDLEGAAGTPPGRAGTPAPSRTGTRPTGTRTPTR